MPLPVHLTSRQPPRLQHYHISSVPAPYGCSLTYMVVSPPVSCPTTCYLPLHSEFGVDFWVPCPSACYIYLVDFVCIIPIDVNNKNLLVSIAQFLTLFNGSEMYIGIHDNLVQF